MSDAQAQIPWVEKYRPRTIDDVIGQPEIVARLKAFVFDPAVPHLLFCGSAGTGKTTCAHAFIHDRQGRLCKPKRTYLELNASDARGIDVVRTDIKDFAKLDPPNGVDVIFIVLDEADSMTAPAQEALRGTMEKYADHARFIIICNYPNKIIPPIQSRCAMFKFKPLTNDEIKSRLTHIASLEHVQVDDAGMNALVYVSNGDCRRAVNYLQACSNLDHHITEELVYQVVGRINPTEIQGLIQMIVRGEVFPARDKILQFMNEYGLSGKNIIRQIHREVIYVPMPIQLRRMILRILGTIEYRLSQGATEDIQIIDMIMQMDDATRQLQETSTDAN